METAESATVIEAVLQSLQAHGATDAFGFPGESTLPLYAAYADSGIQHHMLGCERCAGYAADTYARVSGKLGVVDAPGGIGSPWLPPAILEARNSSTPLLALVSGTNTDKVERWATSECPQEQMFGPIVKKYLRLESADRLEDFLRIVINTALSGRTGPTMLEIPGDIMQRQVTFANAGGQQTLDYPLNRTTADIDSISEAAALLRSAKKPIILAGGGVHLSKSYQEVAALALEYGIPVATSINGKGALDENNALCLGVVGNKGTSSSNDFLKSRDLVIVIGSKLGDKTTNQYKLFHQDAKIIRIDIDPIEWQHIFSREFPLIGDARSTLRLLLNSGLESFNVGDDLLKIARIRSEVSDAYVDIEHPDMAVSPTVILREITRRFGKDVQVCADASVSSGWVGAYGYASGDKRNIITPRGTGSLGFGLPATIGASIANPSVPTFGIGGDGGFAMSVHELETIARLNLNTHYFILDNGKLGLLEAHLSRIMPGNYNQALPRRHPTDWQKIAEGFGIEAVTLTTNRDVVDYMNHLPERPTVARVLVNEKAVSPDTRIAITNS